MRGRALRFFRSRVLAQSSSHRLALPLDGLGFPMSNAPGLGVEFDEAAATREPFKFYNVPNLRRRDGSVTNW
jgi:galactonate dehydratase